MSRFENNPLTPEDAEALKANRKVNRNSSRYWGEWIGILVAAGIIAVVLRAFVFQTFWIPSESMENTLLIGDHLIVNKVSYKYGNIHHGDIVVFKRPPNEPVSVGKDLVKRVIGLPGDTAEARDGIVYINGKPIDEPYLKNAASTSNLTLQTVEPGKVLLLGDNRTNSSDGRVFGQINQDLIVGKVDIRVWPLNRLGYLGG